MVSFEGAVSPDVSKALFLAYKQPSLIFNSKAPGKDGNPILHSGHHCFATLFLFWLISLNILEFSLMRSLQGTNISRRISNIPSKITLEAVFFLNMGHVSALEDSDAQFDHFFPSSTLTVLLSELFGSSGLWTKSPWLRDEAKHEENHWHHSSASCFVVGVCGVVQMCGS